MVSQRQHPSGFIELCQPSKVAGPPGAREEVALDPPTVIRCMNLGSIDVMRLDRTPVASRCVRIKLYLDENFP